MPMQIIDIKEEGITADIAAILFAPTAGKSNPRTEFTIVQPIARTKLSNGLHLIKDVNNKALMHAVFRFEAMKFTVNIAGDPMVHFDNIMNFLTKHGFRHITPENVLDVLQELTDDRRGL